LAKSQKNKSNWANRFCTGKQQIEAIIVIRGFERSNDYFAIGRESGSKMVEFGNISVQVNREVVPPFQKSTVSECIKPQK